VSNATITTYTFKGSVSTNSPTVYYALPLSAPASVSATLSWSKGNLDLYLLSAAGQVVASSATSGQPETLSTGVLPAGSYKLAVVSVSGRTRYTLLVTCTSQ